MMLRSLTFALAVLFTATLGAQEPPEPAKKRGEQIAVELQCITLPQKLARPIIRKLRSEKLEEHAQAIVELEALLDQEKAKLLGWPSLSAHVGEKATYEHIEELRYATEYEPPATSVLLEESNGTVSAVRDSIAGTESAPTATAFDTRNVGLSFEVTLNEQRNDKGVTVDFTAQHVRLKSIDRLVIEQTDSATKRNLKTIQEQPRFLTMKVASSVTMVNGDHRLVGTFPSPEGEDQVELFILSAERLERQ